MGEGYDSNRPTFLNKAPSSIKSNYPPVSEEVPDRYNPYGGASAYLREDMIDVHTHGFSTVVNWEKSYLCPCRNRTTRQPKQACPICNGRGIGFMGPEEIVLMIQTQEKGILNADLGLMDSGTAIGTTERHEKVGFRDRIEVPHAQIHQSMIFDATQSRIDRGFYLIYKVSEIQLAITEDGILKEGEDYTIDYEANRIYPKQHLKGKNISINIITTLRYLVADLLKEHRYAQDMNGELIQLPQKLLLKREDIFIDKEHFEGWEDQGVETDPKRNPNDGLNGFFGGGR